MKYVGDVDDIAEKIFYKLEEISEGTEGHAVEVEAEDKKEAAVKICAELVSFIEENLQEVD